MLTALMWTLGGGEYANVVCNMRGFEFGTAHHKQCVYEAQDGGRHWQPRNRYLTSVEAWENWPPTDNHRDGLGKVERFTILANA